MRRCAFALLLVVTASQAAELTLAEFDNDPTGSSWRIVNDTVMGGRSSSRIEVQDGVLTFKGTLNTNGGGFASVRSGPLQVAADGHDRLRLRAKSDGRTYQVRLTAESTGTTYRALFVTEPGTWQTFDIPLQQFQAVWRGRLLDRPPIRAQDIDGVGILLADGKDGPFEVSVDWIALSGPPQR